MTSIGIRDYREQGRRVSVPRRALFTAGVLSAMLYVTMDVVSAMRTPGYSMVNQAISELSAIGAPTQPLWSTLGVAFDVLLIAFALGVIRAAGRARAMRATGIMLLVLGLSGVLWLFFPMNQRGAEFSSSDLGHIVLSAGSILLILGFIGTGAVTLGRDFRRYSFATILVFLAAGASTFLYVNRLLANEPTPWMGVVERIGIYSYLLWIAVYAVALLRGNRETH